MGAMDKVVLILGSGPWRGVEFLTKLAAVADQIIAADGGGARARELKIKVDLVIGDLDSLSPQEHEELERSGIEIITYPAEKDRTDLELALDYAISLGPQKIVLFGALGGRLDQSLVNIFLLEKAARAGIAAELVAEAERIYLVHNRLELTTAKPGDLVSAIPLSAEVKGIRTWGLRYQLHKEKLVRASSRGISNEVVGLPAGVALEEGLLLVILRG